MNQETITELIDALEECRGKMITLASLAGSGNSRMTEWWKSDERARAAIAKAKGESK